MTEYPCVCDAGSFATEQELLQHVRNEILRLARSAERTGT